ncbi:MAG: transglutaminase-like domain-containing protein [Phycisphaerales bacterium]
MRRLAAGALRALLAAGAVSWVMSLAVAAHAQGAAPMPAPRAGWTLVEEHFYALTLGGHPCGRTSERVERDGDRFRTVSTIEMRFVRLGEETRIELSSEFVEDARGEPIEATVRQRGAETVRYVFESPRRARVERGAVREVRELASDAWLTPREISKFIEARHAAKASEIRFEALDVQSGFVVTAISMKRLGEVERAVADRTLRLVQYEVRNSIQPVVAKDLYDAEAQLCESTTAIGLGDLVSRKTTRAAADECHARASFDLLAGTFVPSPRIPAYETRGALELRLEATAGEMPDLPTEGSQAFRRVDARAAIVSVDVLRASGEQPGDRSDPRWLKPNELIDSDSAPVRALLERARLAADASPRDRANALRLLVARHLRDKNMATAFGSASEAAKSRSGDCTEHAVLLAALCRAAGIPARVASGLVYVPDLGGKGPGWGWHLWTQALVEPPIVAGGGGLGWVDFDATISSEGRGHHPAHILVATSDLSGGATDPAFSRALSLIGALKVEVLGDGAPRDRASESAPARVPAGRSTP